MFSLTWQDYLFVLTWQYLLYWIDLLVQGSQTVWMFKHEFKQAKFMENVLVYDSMCYCMTLG